MQLPLLACLAALGSFPSQDGTPALDRVEQRANTFTQSSQDAVALACSEAGQALLVWQSRRQQEGTYGVYARRFGTDGQPLTAEVQINQQVRSHQMQPTVALAPDGSAWFSWRSFAADGDRGAIVARRFSPDLEKATDEVLVNVQTEGHQSDPQVIGLADGGAYVAWLSPGEEGDSVQVLGRRLAADGQPSGDVQRLDQGGDHVHRTPCLRSAGDQLWISYGRTDAKGRSQGVFLRALDASGAPSGEELRLDDGDGIEAVFDLNAKGQGLATWFVPSANGYRLRVRSVEHRGEDGWQLSEARDMTTQEIGYTSGSDVAMQGERALVSWSQFLDGERKEAGVFAQLVDAEGAAQGEVFRATQASEGPQILAAATGTRRSWIDGQGRMAFAWNGNGGLDDKSGAHLSLIVPEGVDAPEESYALVAPEALTSAQTEQPEGAASPHDLPVFDPRDVEDRIDEPVVFGTSGIDFLGFSNTGWTPPDPEMAVGPNHIVAAVNGGIAWYTKDGTQEFQQDINGSGGFWGSVGASTFVFDPEIVWDPFAERFVAFASDANQGFLLAVSDDDDPNGNWNKYLIDTGPIFGTQFVDSGNLAVDDQVISITGDIFGPDRLVMMFIDKSSALSGGPLVFTDDVISGRQSMGACTNYTGGEQPLYMAWGNESASASNIRIYAVTDRLTSPAVQNVSIPVPTYTFPGDPPQAGSSVRPELFEARFWSAMVRDGFLWATHHQGSSRATQRWYQIDLNGWPASGTNPTVVQSGDIDLGPGIWTFFGSIWADAAGNMAMSFARSSSSEFISMQMTYRLAADAPGTVRTPILIRDSVSPSGNRWGDYSATNDDPASPGSFWGHHEYRGPAAWRTRIARIDLCPPAVSYCSTAPNSVGNGALMSNTGSTSIAANDLVLQAGPAPFGQPGIFYYGPDQLQVPFGEGFRCVGGQTTRLLPVAIDGAGIATQVIDYGSLPPGGQILPGSVLNFQFWYRDPAGGGSNFNLSDGLQLTFCE